MNARQRARRKAEAAYEEAGQFFRAAAGIEDTAEDVLGQPALISPEEVEAIRWAGYDSAIADGTTHLDRSLSAASDRLERVMRGAYLEYGQAVAAAFDTFGAVRRTAMHAHELANAGELRPTGRM